MEVLIMAEEIKNDNMATEAIETDIGSDADLLGNVKINSDVIATISGIACTEVSGVAGMSGGFTGDIATMLGKKSFSKGVKVQVNDKKTIIDLYIIVEYGIRIPDVAWKCQESVKKAVTEYCGFESIEVNVHVQGINMKDNVKEEEE
jgi:uncharacterized alkaline shock family protein YloU